MSDGLAVHITDPEDVWLYLIEPPYGAMNDAVPAADGRPLTSLARRHWWAGPDGVTSVTLEARPLSRTTGYRLPDGVVLPGYPTEMTVAEWADLDDDEDVTLRLYEPVRVQEEADPITVPLTVVEVPRLDLDDYTLTWKARLPWAVTQIGGLAEAFPGEFEGVRALVKERLDQLPGAAHVFLRTGSGNNYASISVPLAPSQHKPSTGRRGTNGYRAAVTSKAVKVPLGWVPDKVPGRNAGEAWDAVQAIVADAVERCTFHGVICPSCSGDGMIANPGVEA